MRLLLLSNSSNYGSGYLDHAVDEVKRHFDGKQRVLFVPFALHDQAGYHARARERFADFGIELNRLEEGPTAAAAVEQAKGIFIGGGNTFRLLDRLQRSGVVEAIRRRALAGMPYMGASAGTVIAAPTLKTTNDMPIVQPSSFQSLDLVPFQINCHYLDADPATTHMGETREQRLKEFHEENDIPVVGLREGGILRVSADAGAMHVTLAGTAGARILRRGEPPEERKPGDSLDDLIPRPCRPPLVPRSGLR